MAIQVQLENGSLVAGGGAAFKGANVHVKPIDHGAHGHYRTTVAVGLVASQVLNSRILELRNAGSNLIIPTKVEVSVMPVGAVAQPYLLYIGLVRCTGFTAVDTTNVAIPSVSPMRTTMPAAPGGAQVRSVTIAGHASGMAGGTLSKDSGYLSILAAWMASVSSTTQPVTRDFVGSVRPDMHPLVCAANEGFVLEQLNAGSATSNQVVVVVDIAWAELPVGGF